MYSKKRNNFKPAPWGLVKNTLKPILGKHFEEAQRRVLSNQERAFFINDYSIGLFRAEGSELVVCAFSGDLKECAVLIATQARSRGFKTIRAHITRRSELRFLKSCGLDFKLIESQKCKALNCNEYVIRLVL